jgi:hypothetical protein
MILPPSEYPCTIPPCAYSFFLPVSTRSSMLAFDSVGFCGMTTCSGAGGGGATPVALFTASSICRARFWPAVQPETFPPSAYPTGFCPVVRTTRSSNSSFPTCCTVFTGSAYSPLVNAAGTCPSISAGTVSIPGGPPEICPPLRRSGTWPPRTMPRPIPSTDGRGRRGRNTNGCASGSSSGGAGGGAFPGPESW